MREGEHSQGTSEGKLFYFCICNCKVFRSYKNTIRKRLEELTLSNNKKIILERTAQKKKNQNVLGKPDTHVQKNEIKPLLYTIYKNLIHNGLVT